MANNKKFIDPTLTFTDGKGELLKNLRKAIQNKLASNNYAPSTNALRKFVNEALNETNVNLSNNNKKNIMNRLVYDYASLRRKNLN